MNITFKDSLLMIHQVLATPDPEQTGRRRRAARRPLERRLESPRREERDAGVPAQGSPADARQATPQTPLHHSASRSRTATSGRHAHTHHARFPGTPASSYHRPAPTASPHQGCARATAAADTEPKMAAPRQRPDDRQSPPPPSVCVSDWTCLTPGPPIGQGLPPE